MALRHAIILWGRALCVCVFAWPRRWAQDPAGHINVAVAECVCVCAWPINVYVQWVFSETFAAKIRQIKYI